MKKIVLLIGIPLIVIVAIRNIFPTEKERVKRDINALRRAFEKEHASEALMYIDSSYSDQNNMTYEVLANTMHDLLLEIDSCKVVISGLTVTIDSIAHATTYASCSLGLKVLGRYERERVIVFGGIVKPASVRAYLKKSDKHYAVYSAQY